MKLRPSLLLVGLLSTFTANLLASEVLPTSTPNAQLGYGHGLQMELNPSIAVSTLLGYRKGDEVSEDSEGNEGLYAEAFAKYKLKDLIAGVGMTTDMANRISSSSAGLQSNTHPVIFTEYRQRTWSLGVKWAQQQAKDLSGQIINDQSFEAYMSLELM